MTHQEFRETCLAMPGSDQHFPFDQVTEVFRIHGKMFALCNIDQSTEAGKLKANLKCDPDLAADLRQKHPDFIVPGFHMNKRHWNTVTLNAELDDTTLRWLVEHSYNCVLETLPKRLRRV